MEQCNFKISFIDMKCSKGGRKLPDHVAETVVLIYIFLFICFPFNLCLVISQHCINFRDVLN